MRLSDIAAAAPSWGRRLVFAAASLMAAASAQAADPTQQDPTQQDPTAQDPTAQDPTPQSLHAAGLLTLPEPCVVSREELMHLAPDENVWIGALSETSWIAIALCEHHAYQSTEVALRVEARDGSMTSSVMAFPLWREGEETLWPYIGYQPWLTGLAGELAEGRISLVYKGRGVGDCGERVTFDLRAPVARIVEYRAKFECDGNWIEPEEWPAVPQQVLDDYAPAFTDRRAGDLLSAVILRWPWADWMGHAIVRGDLDGDGVEEQWIGGHSRNWDTEQSRYHLVREQAGELRAWDFPVATDAQTALCQPAASLALEAPGVLAIDDGLCDRLRVGWDREQNTISISRN